MLLKLLHLHKGVFHNAVENDSVAVIMKLEWKITSLHTGDHFQTVQV